MPPFGHLVSPSGEVWDACAARGKVGPVMGLRPLHPDAKSRFTGFGPPSAATPPGGKTRKSVAYGAASRDLLLIFGRVDVANTPSGLRPFAPPCIPPPEAPP